MSWPRGLAQELTSGTYPLALRLEVVSPATGEGLFGSVAGWHASSTADGNAYAIILIRDGYRVSLGSQAIVPVSWQYVEGAWSLFVQIPEGQRLGGRRYSVLAAKALRRGAMVRLMIGRQGDREEEYAPLKLGRIYAVRSAGHPRTYRVEVWDIKTAFRSRMTATSVASQQRAKLFYGSAAQQNTVAGGGYTVGDSTLTLGGATQDRFIHETGAAGAIRLTGDSSGEFLLTYTAVNNSTKTLSGVSSTGQFVTTAGDAGAGNSADSVCLLQGHPVDILRKILVSTGDGTNGSFDVYPRAWGLGVPAEMIDGASFDQAKRILTVSGGTYDWQVLVEEEQADPASFLESIFRPAGIWYCVREGQIVCRVARSMHDAGFNRQRAPISDNDLIEVPTVSWYPTDQPETYFRAVVQDLDVTLAFSRSSTSTLPVRLEVIYNLLGVFRSYNTSAGTAHVTRIAGDIRDRLSPWAHMVPEYVDVVLRGIRSYAPGDVVRFSCSSAYGRLDGTRDGYRDRPVTVIRSAMDLSSNSTKLTLATLPVDLQEDGGAT